jgi:hypothetical protein
VRFRFGKHLAVAAVVALGYGTAGPAIAAVAGAPSWMIQSTPSPGGRRGSILLGVSCPSARACTAVGFVAPLSRPEGTIIEHWNGRKWVVQPMPRVKNGDLEAVSCSSARACTAVGYDRMGTLAERWDGRKWAVQSTLNPVTGTYFSELVGVSCSSATSCTAIGDSDSSDDKSDTLTEHWNGAKWAIQAAPKPPSGNESYLTGVSCPSAKVCTAVGAYGSVNGSWTLAERWNGAKWVVQSTPNPSGSQNSELAGVSCPSATVCAAVGTPGEATLAERWNGTKWALQHAPNPAGSGASPLLGVSCSSATACTAVGPYVNKSGAELTLAERYS